MMVAISNFESTISIIAVMHLELVTLAFAISPTSRERGYDVMLDSHMFGEGIGTSEGLIAFCSSVILDMSQAKCSRNEPGREQINGFSPVCERICEIRAKREV